jgi:ribose transport system substrate-binding protein
VLLAGLALAALACIAPALAASGTSGHATAAKAVTPTSLPAAVRSNYTQYQTFSKLFGDPYASYKPPAPPWKFCESTNYLANGWEKDNQSELQALVGQYQKAGLAKGGLTTVNSNTSVPVQITQLNTLMSSGCNVIFAIPGSQTAFCPTFAKAKAKNILIVTDDTPIFCDNVMNSSFPEYSSAFIQADTLAKSLGGKGNVIIETGIPGAVGESVTVNAFLDALKKYPGIKVLGQVAGDWTQSVAETETVKFLATHPQKVDGVLDGAGMSTGAALALQQSGRPSAKTSLYEAECSTMALWKKDPGLVVAAQNQGPAMSAYESFLVAARLLAGQHAMVNTLLYPIPGPTKATFSQWYKPSMTVKSTCFATPPQSALVKDSYYDKLFTGGSKPKVQVHIVDVG